MPSKKGDKLTIKGIKDVNTVLCEYFASYCIHGTIVTGIPLSVGTRVFAVINEEDKQFTNIVVNNPLKFKSFLNDAKVTKTERHESDKNIKLIYHADEDIEFKLPKYTSDIGETKNANTPFQMKIIDSCRDNYFEGEPISTATLEALANKKFVCIGGVIFAKSELPLTHKCSTAHYWKVYANNDETEFAFKTRDDLVKNYLVVRLDYDRVTVYKMVAYAFPATEFNM